MVDKISYIIMLEMVDKKMFLLLNVSFFFTLISTFFSCDNRIAIEEDLFAINDTITDTVPDSEISILTFKDLIMHQSMAFFDERAFFITPVNNQLYCHIYNINDGNIEKEITLPYKGYPIPHANVSCFGGNFYSTISIAPALYVSSWDKGRQAFVYDISKDKDSITSKLLQVIDPKLVSDDIIGAGNLDWVVDSERGHLYSIAYHLKESALIIENNYTHITKFKLPSLDKKEVKLTDLDVLDNYTVPVMNAFQDKCFHDGCIYVVAGIPHDSNLFPPRLFVIDTNDKKMSESSIPIVGEPEGFCYYSGQMWLNMYGSPIVYNIEKLIENKI